MHLNRNKPLNKLKLTLRDFTTIEYRKLLKLAKKNYDFASYNSIPWKKKFVLWRHDVDASLNRGLALAKIEHEEGLKSTYFINLHSQLYNVNEISQFKIISKILSLGHEIGLHLDFSFYNIKSKKKLDQVITHESKYLEYLFKKKPVAFSFHNPSAHSLRFDEDRYGDLINCYSKKLKTNVAYVSDSNGYWRFQRLKNILQLAKDNSIQVLTHPEWWQSKILSPRQRIFRSIYGRATANLESYDNQIKSHKRINFNNVPKTLEKLQKIFLRMMLYDYRNKIIDSNKLKIIKKMFKKLTKKRL